jgi:translation elongation factor EF-1alpha
MLAKALGVSGFIVAITKMGTQDWSKERFDAIKDQVAPFL